jgi:S-DNA-T family DNA segregation ATPase FtsK/SpoIIIE
VSCFTEGAPVQIVFDDGLRTRELDVTVERPDALVGDLAAALGIRRGALFIEGRRVAAELGLGEAGLVAGAVVRLSGSVRPPEPSTAVLVRVVGGLSAGSAIPLPPGVSVVGRGDGVAVALDDTGVSRNHCELTVALDGRVTVRDRESLNGTDVNGVRVSGTVPVGPEDLVSVGGAALLSVLPVDGLGPVRVMDPVREAGAGGTVPFTRQPRATEPVDLTPVALPRKPTRQARATFNLAAMLAPLATAGATVAVFHDLRYAAISVLTPLMMVANLIEDRTRGRLSMRLAVRDFHREVERLREGLSAHREAEVQRRRAAHPDVAELVFRAEGPSPRLWERRPPAPDFLVLAAGTADLRWSPPVRADPQPEIAPEVSATLDEFSRLPCVPVPVELSGGGVVGLSGDRAAVLAVARSLLLQAVTTSGPADLAVVVATDDDRAADWDWTKWLPHTADRRGGPDRMLAAGQAAVDRLTRILLEDPDSTDDRPADVPGPALLLVVDGAALLEGRPCPLRELLSGRRGSTAGIVLTDRLPATCSVTLDVDIDGTGRLRRMRTGERVDGLLATGVPEPLARRCARALARFEDPELRVPGAGLPDRVALLRLLKLTDPTPAAVAERWRAGAGSLRAGAVLGVSEREVFAVDLDDDGPHALIAGTTGSGKSELLRTLVASLALGNDPEHLTFALVDYKGGGAFDKCAPLPHVVGLVTDLDEQLGARALRCLQAELRRRERMLREVGVSHIREYQRLRDRQRPELEPMPRLVVVIDEFAQLVAELPTFVDSLVGVAQLGRSLGTHLVIATQQPRGSVSDAIKNNVKLRIALRLLGTSDSVDVIDSPAAAHIGGRQWGRACYRLSARRVLPVQTAIVSESEDRVAGGPVRVRAFRFGAEDAPTGTASGTDGPTALDRVVATARAAFAAAGMRPPRTPWPDPLPPVVRMGELPEVAACGLVTDTAGLPTLALADDPDRQTQYPVGWDPRSGNLLLYGMVGSGTTSALATVALATARRLPPDACHLYVLDLGAGELAPLAELPHIGAYVGPAEPERRNRLVRMLRRMLEERKAAPGTPWPVCTLVVDNLAAFFADNDSDQAGLGRIDDLQRVFAEGPAVGIRVAAAADRPGAVPGPWAALTQQKLLFQLGDPTDYGAFQLRTDSIPSFVPGRAVTAGRAQVVQVAWPGGNLAGAVREVAAGWPGASRTAPGVGLLPTLVHLHEIGARAVTSGDPWSVPVGIADSDLRPAGLTLYEREHALVAGPSRSGRSNALRTIAETLLAADRPPAVLVYTPRRSPPLDGLADTVTRYEDLGPALEGRAGRPLVVLVDDADTEGDPSGILDRLLGSASAGVHVVAAVRADALRRAYGHWAQRVRDSRCGILLVPDHDLDGDLLGVTLPRHDRMAPLPGRGYLCLNGHVDGFQVALPG